MKIYLFRATESPLRTTANKQNALFNEKNQNVAEDKKRINSYDKTSAMQSSDFKSNYSTDFDSLRKVNNFLSNWLDGEEGEKTVRYLNKII